MMKAHAKVGKGTMLLGDSMGGLYLCDFGGEGLVVQRVGETSICSGLAYLDSGVVFVGSGLGDSMLVRLSEGGLEVLDTIKNLGPIVDFVCGEQGLVICGGGGVKQVRLMVGDWNHCLVTKAYVGRCDRSLSREAVPSGYITSQTAMYGLWNRRGARDKYPQSLFCQPTTLTPLPRTTTVGPVGSRGERARSSRFGGGEAGVGGRRELGVRFKRWRCGGVGVGRLWGSRGDQQRRL